MTQATRTRSATRSPLRRTKPDASGGRRHVGVLIVGSGFAGLGTAIRLAKDMGPGHTIVTILCDYGTRYQSKLFNPEFLRSKKLPVPEWLEQKKSEISIPYEKI